MLKTTVRPALVLLLVAAAHPAGGADERRSLAHLAKVSAEVVLAGDARRDPALPAKADLAALLTASLKSAGLQVVKRGDPEADAHCRLTVTLSQAADAARRPVPGLYGLRADLAVLQRTRIVRTGGELELPTWSMTRSSYRRGAEVAPDAKIMADQLLAALVKDAEAAKAEDKLEQADKRDEAAAWGSQEKTAKDALGFWIRFLDFRHGAANDKKFDATDDPGETRRKRILCVIRAISWVESRHGTAGGSSKADPMQCGNPRDSWWKELTDQAAVSSRFIGGPGAKNYNANELDAKAAADAAFPEDAKVFLLGDSKKGHGDPKFNATMSYHWGIVYFAHRTNTRKPKPGHREMYKFDDCTLERLINGAVAYNGGGDPKYESKIRHALSLFGCP